jgi:hypothetical protein
MPIAATGARIVGTDGRPGNELTTPVARPHPSHMVLRRVKVSAPNVAQDAKGNPFANTSDGTQSALRRSAESGTIGRRE